MKKLFPLIFVAGVILIAGGLITFSYGLLSASTRSGRELNFWCGCGCILVGGILVTLSSLLEEGLTGPEGLERAGGNERSESIESLLDIEPFERFGRLEDLQGPKILRGPEDLTGLESIERLERRKGFDGSRKPENPWRDSVYRLFLTRTKNK